MKIITKNSWKGSIEMDGGTLYTQFSHFIDLIIWMFGDIKEVNGFKNNFNHSKSVKFEDTGVVSLKFYSGSLGTINFTINSFNKNMEGSLTIIAEKGTIKIGGQYLNELEYQEIKNLKLKIFLREIRLIIMGLILDLCQIMVKYIKI